MSGLSSKADTSAIAWPAPFNLARRRAFHQRFGESGPPRAEGVDTGQPEANGGLDRRHASLGLRARPVAVQERGAQRPSPCEVLCSLAQPELEMDGQVGEIDRRVAARERVEVD